MFFCKKYTNHSLKTIGLHFGGRDHTTVIHAIKNVEDFVEVDPKYREMVEEIRNKIELQSR
jgi:chromosomal replication initiator protein